MVAELEELSFRAISPASSSLRGVTCSQVIAAVLSLGVNVYFLLTFLWFLLEQEQTAGGDVPQQIHKENSGLSRLQAAQVRS